MFTLEQIRNAAVQSRLEPDAVKRLMVTLTKTAVQPEALTIICNEAVHPIPIEQLPGRVFAVTTGNLPDLTADDLTAAIADACRHVAHLIKQEGPFSEIYLVPSGYGALLQKLAETILQITGQPAVTLHYDRRSQTYWPVCLDLRALIADA